jgi:hypothetical protein
MRRVLSLCLLLCLSTGCSLFNRVRVDPIATAYQKPSNVAAYVAVSDADEPITGLEPQNFEIYENGQLLSADDSRLVLLPQEVATYHHTLLLIDLSGEKAADDKLARAAASFVETLRGTQAITVYAFDGTSSLRWVADVSRSADTSPVDLRALAKMGSGDPSRNLNGALLSGLKELSARLTAQPKVVKVGTLAVFTRGPDLAGRVSQAEIADVLRETRHDIVAIGVADPAASTLTNLGKNGVFEARDEDSLGVAFENAALRARALYDRYYLVAYCSPARAGIRHIELQVHFRDTEGDDKAASFSQDIDASGFGPGCRADAVPRFLPQLAKQAARSAKPSDDAKPQPADHPEPTRSPEPAGDDDSVAPPPNRPGYSH